MNRVLNLNQLANGMPGLTPELGSVFAQAAAVCFEGSGHQCGVKMPVDGTFNDLFLVHWPHVTDQMIRSHADPRGATEYAACCVAILLAREILGLYVYEKSYIGTGFDYWLGETDDENQLPFMDKTRLEVSGILAGNQSDINTRAGQKLKQIDRSHQSLPGVVVIVEFSAPVSRMDRK